jgi:uncharacterized protein (DUF2235 family)
LAKNIVICSDGTWNTAFKNRGTNVFKLFEAVDVNGHKIDPNVTPQIAFYDDGVGTGGGRLWKLLGGAFGFGLARNVRQLYTELARTYVPGDHLYFFGFSRGAFTVRTLVGLVDLCGIPDRSKVRSDGELRKLVRKAYGVYRWKYAAWLQRAVDAMLKMSAGLSLRRAAPWWEVRAASHPGAPRVPFVGVWDTVDAIGLPVAGAAHLLNTLVFRFKFPNRTLTAIVDRACQALSIDDQRKTFHPILWDASGEDGARIEQVWFAGVHANVGGGYPKQGMSLVALDWMMTNGGSAGLRFAPGAPDGYRQRRNVNDKIYDSRAGPASFYRYMPRDIAVLCRTNGVVPRIHVSALERIVQGTEGYAPGNIPGKSAFVPTDGTYPEGAVEGCSEELSGMIERALEESESLLDRVRWRVRTRHWSHLVLLGAAVALVVIVARGANAAAGVFVPRSLEDWQTLGAGFGQAVKTGHLSASVAIGLALVAVCSGLIVVRMRSVTNRILSEFWYRAKPDLAKAMACMLRR